MSFDDLPNEIKKGIQQYAGENHLSHDEAVIRLIEKGLENCLTQPAINGLSGIAMSDDEAALVDDAVDLAMEARRHRSERLSRG
jgi:hypothetical protein